MDNATEQETTRTATVTTLDRCVTLSLSKSSFEVGSSAAVVGSLSEMYSNVWALSAKDRSCENNCKYISLTDFF